MTLDFEGRVAIVTGAGRGMGREHALMLASRGARVVINDIAKDDADATVSEIGERAVADYSDVATDADQLVRTATDAFGQLDIVINNAAIIRAGLFWEQDPTEWWSVFDTALRGTVEVTRAAWPHLMASGTGRVINVGSEGMLANTGLSAYGAAKGAIWALGNVLAAEGARVRVQVATIMPSAFTPMTYDVQLGPAVMETLQQKLTADHVAAFVAFLAHQDTTVAGATFQVSGGRAGRMVFAAQPTVNADESSPEGWARVADALLRDDVQLTGCPDMGTLFADKLIAANPGLVKVFSQNDPGDVGV